MQSPSPNLDILRALAVTLVLVNHLWDKPVTALIGHSAVLIFFVHTFLVLMLSLARQGADPNWVGHFYLRRFFRIYPLPVFCVCMLFVLRVPIQSISVYGITPTPGLVLRNLLLIQGFHESIIGPMWSLPFEVKMYLVLPLLFVVLRRGPGWPNRLMLVFVADVLILVLTPRVTDFFAYFPCFLGGALAYLLDVRPRLPWWLWPACIICLSVAYAKCPSSDRLIFPEWGLCLGLGYLIPHFQECTSAAVARIAAIGAKYSYGIYLSHYPLIWFCLKQKHGGWWLFVLLMVMVPVALYHLIEEPMIRFGRRLTRPSRAKTPGIISPAEVVEKPLLEG